MRLDPGTTAQEMSPPGGGAAVHDKLFREKQPLVGDFHFGKGTAEVFDDMLDRSVPFYEETQRMVGELAADFAAEGTNLYDLGCSTANTFLRIDEGIAPGVKFVGIDSSQAMLDKAREKLAAAHFSREFELVRADLNEGLRLSNASAVILNLTLQFVRPLVRGRVVEGISAGLNEGGCLLLIEKVLAPSSTINRLFIKHYYEFKKRNGYSDLEIAQKREALENVLVPYHLAENTKLLLESGFSTCEMFFRWYNFCGIIAIK